MTAKAALVAASLLWTVYAHALQSEEKKTSGRAGEGALIVSADEAEADPNTARARVIPGKGFELKSRDQRFRLVTRVFAQLLYTASDEAEDWEQAFQLRRARLQLFGHFYNEHNKYFVQFAMSPGDLKFEDGTPTKSPVFDWIFKFDYLRDLSFQVGQYRVPYSKQRLLSFTNLQFFQRSLANDEFNLDRDIGLNFYSDDFLGLDRLRYQAGIFIGEGRDEYTLSDFGMLYVARLEYLPLGLFRDNIEADLERHSRPKLTLGVAYAFLDNAKGNKGILGDVPSDGGTTDTHNVTADVMLKWAGFSFSGDFYYRHGNRNYGEEPARDENGDVILDDDGNPVVDREEPRDGIGWLAQVGYLLPPIPFEIVGRYGQVYPVGDDTSLVREDEVGWGVNWYIYGTSVALGADYHYRFVEGDGSQGYNEIQVRFQGGF